jgi:flavin reductase (DIM6/NTAB) family NADH-FMN oxidoreductase RutF
MPVDAEQFRRIAGSFPTGVVIVTAPGPRGLTTNAVASVSLDPPLVLVCIDRASRTLPAIVEARAFVVNYLAEGRADLARRFAMKSDDKFDGVSWEGSRAAAGAPILRDDAIAWAECTLEQMHEAGDHVMCVGRVEEGGAPGGAPLTYFRREYGRG